MGWRARVRCPIRFTMLGRIVHLHADEDVDAGGEPVDAAETV